MFKEMLLFSLIITLSFVVAFSFSPYSFQKKQATEVVQVTEVLEFPDHYPTDFSNSDLISRRLDNGSVQIFHALHQDHPMFDSFEDYIVKIEYDKEKGVRDTVQSYAIDLLTDIYETPEGGLVSVWSIHPYKNKTVQYHHDFQCQINEGLDHQGKPLPQCFFSGRIFSQSSIEIVYETITVRR